MTAKGTRIQSLYTCAALNKSDGEAMCLNRDDYKKKGSGPNQAVCRLRYQKMRFRSSPI
jgi:hypothetical protein